MKPFSVSSLNPGLFISNTILSYAFFSLKLAGWRNHSTENVFWHKNVYDTGSYSSIWSENLTCVCRMSISNSIYVNLQCKLQFSVAALAVLQQSAAAAAVARQHTVFHSSTLLWCWAEVSFSSHFISPYIHISALVHVLLHTCVCHLNCAVWRSSDEYLGCFLVGLILCCSILPKKSKVLCPCQSIRVWLYFSSC